MEQLKYPIGQCIYKEEYTASDMQRMLLDIETFPKRLEAIVQHLSEAQLQTPYRPEGWTVNQVIHHCGDSHLNALLRIKLALSNECPTINPYPEAVWATMPDYNLPFNVTLTMLHCIHEKLNALLRSLHVDQLNRTYYHPQYEKTFRIYDVICLYAWHGNHHLAHINLVAHAK